MLVDVSPTCLVLCADVRKWVKTVCHMQQTPTKARAVPPPIRPKPTPPAIQPKPRATDPDPPAAPGMRGVHVSVCVSQPHQPQSRSPSSTRWRM